MLIENKECQYIGGKHGSCGNMALKLCELHIRHKVQELSKPKEGDTA